MRAPRRSKPKLSVSPGARSPSRTRLQQEGNVGLRCNVVCSVALSVECWIATEFVCVAMAECLLCGIIPSIIFVVLCGHVDGDVLQCLQLVLPGGRSAHGRARALAAS
jgi:hypothetical protein